uniref:Secreted protein n=1 Tax=Arundo donax TaxID=35708 RepID=A0A0A9GS92_ARUDO
MPQGLRQLLILLLGSFQLKCVPFAGSGPSSRCRVGTSLQVRAAPATCIVTAPSPTVPSAMLLTYISKRRTSPASSHRTLLTSRIFSS